VERARSGRVALSLFLVSAWVEGRKTGSRRGEGPIGRFSFRQDVRGRSRRGRQRVSYAQRATGRRGKGQLWCGYRPPALGAPYAIVVQPRSARPAVVHSWANVEKAGERHVADGRPLMQGRLLGRGPRATCSPSWMPRFALPWTTATRCSPPAPTKAYCGLFFWMIASAECLSLLNYLCVVSSGSHSLCCDCLGASK